MARPVVCICVRACVRARERERERDRERERERERSRTVSQSFTCRIVAMAVHTKRDVDNIEICSGRTRPKNAQDETANTNSPGWQQRMYGRLRDGGTPSVPVRAAVLGANSKGARERKYT